MSERNDSRRAGDAITRRSFEIIRERLGSFSAPPEIMELIVRVAHTTGDVDFAKTIVFSPGSVRKGIGSLRSGAPVIADVGMVRSGIRGEPLASLGSTCRCLLDEAETTALAARLGLTRSAAAMRRAAPQLNGSIVAIGNAPTALFELLSLVESGAASPALVIGVPVGFVGALDSKLELAKTTLPHITNLSERGGSPIAAALVNGLVHLASLERDE